jgi:hypothetical protein
MGICQTVVSAIQVVIAKKYSFLPNPLVLLSKAALLYITPDF